MIEMNNKMGLVSVILLNYNGKQFNKNCIDSILLQTYENYEIIFVDNNSTDGSLEEIEDIYAEEIKIGKIKIVKNSENLRFAGGNNVGVKNVSKNSEYVWLLNNDTIIDENCLLYLIEAMQNDESLGAVSSIILDKGFEYLIQNNIEHGKTLRMNAFGVQIREPAKNINGVLYTNFLCGCSFLYRHSILDYPFFDFYQIYSEDTQLSWEIIYKGYKLGICRNSIVYHYGSATTNKNPYTKTYLGTRNSFINFLIFLSKKTRIKIFVLFLFFHCLYLLFNFKKFPTLLKVDYDSMKWIMKNKDKIELAKNRIKNSMIISEVNFLETMPYKLLDGTLYSGKVVVGFIDFLNLFAKVYYKIFHIPCRD